MTRTLLVLAVLLAASCGPPLTPDEQLQRAAAHSDAAEIAQLVAAGARVDNRDDDGWTPLMHASAYGNAGAVRALIQAHADTTVTTKEKGQAPLTLAARWNRVEVVRELIADGAPVGQRDDIGWTALMWAAIQGRTDVCEALVRGGANVNYRDSENDTPLILAAQRGHLDTVRLLLAAGAAPSVSTREGETAKSLAVKNGYSEIAALLP